MCDLVKFLVACSFQTSTSYNNLFNRSQKILKVKLVFSRPQKADWASNK